MQGRGGLMLLGSEQQPSELLCGGNARLDSFCRILIWDSSAEPGALAIGPSSLQGNYLVAFFGVRDEIRCCSLPCAQDQELWSKCSLTD